ncbi:MAG: LamG domain-containing protein [Victivallales bacterium]|nr:LamG domain-containing protein [Victivallales bacterium]
MTTEENTSGAQFQFSPNGESDWSDTQRKTDSYMRFVFNITSYSNAIKLPGSDPEWPLVWPANMFPQDIAATKWSNITALPEADNNSYNYPVYNVDHASTEGLGLFLLEIPDKAEAMTISITAQPANALASGNNMEWLADFCIYRDGATEGVISTVSLGNTAFNPTGQTTSFCKLSLAKLTDGTLTAQAGDRIAFAVYPNTTSAVSPKQTDWQVSCIKFDVLDEAIIDVDSDLIAHWVYTEDVAATGTWTDSSGNNRDLTLEDNAFVDSNGLNLDGANDQAVTSATMGISGSSARTVSFWINPANLENDSYYGMSLISMGQWASTKLFHVGIIGTNNADSIPASIIRLTNYGGRIYSTTSLEEENWCFVTASYDGTTGYVYINGVMEGSDSITMSTDDSVVRISQSFFNNSAIWSWKRFNGCMDDIRVYDRCLTDNEIAYLYEQGRGQA